MNAQSQTDVLSDVITIVVNALTGLVAHRPWDWSGSDWITFPVVLALSFAAVFLSGKALILLTRLVNGTSFSLAGRNDKHLKSIFVVMILSGFAFLIAHLSDPKETLIVLKELTASSIFVATESISAFFVYTALAFYLAGYAFWAISVFRAQGVVVGVAGGVLGLPICMAMAIAGYVFGVLILIALIIAFFAELGRPRQHPV